jgi:hypothetical protein
MGARLELGTLYRAEGAIEAAVDGGEIAEARDVPVSLSQGRSPRRRMETMIAYLRLLMAGCLFLLGFSSCVGGLWMILARQYRSVLQNVSAQSARVSTKAITDAALAPVIDALSGLIEAINQLVRTSVGVGVFLCLAGAILCLVAFQMVAGM